MSYARWGCDGSDVYVYAAEDGHGDVRFVCCHCALGGGCFDAQPEMIAHLLKHREAGHVVPQYAIERLQREADMDPSVGASKR